MSGDLSMERIKRVQLKRVTFATREYDAVIVHLGDLRLSADIVSDRQIGLAQRLAASHGVELEVSPELQPRVQAVLQVPRRG